MIQRKFTICSRDSAPTAPRQDRSALPGDRATWLGRSPLGTVVDLPHLRLDRRSAGQFDHEKYRWVVPYFHQREPLTTRLARRKQLTGKLLIGLMKIQLEITRWASRSRLRIPQLDESGIQLQIESYSTGEP